MKQYTMLIMMLRMKKLLGAWWMVIKVVIHIKQWRDETVEEEMQCDKKQRINAVGPGNGKAIEVKPCQHEASFIQGDVLARLARTAW